MIDSFAHFDHILRSLEFDSNLLNMTVLILSDECSSVLLSSAFCHYYLDPEFALVTGPTV